LTAPVGVLKDAIKIRCGGKYNNTVCRCYSEAKAMKKWSHPGGKLRELGAEALSEAELLAILISTGIKGKPAAEIAEEIVERFKQLTGLVSPPFRAGKHGRVAVKVIDQRENKVMRVLALGGTR
jgi:hypothetical protein